MGWDAGHEFQRFLTATGIFLGEPQSLANPSETVVRFSWARSVLGPVQFLGPRSVLGPVILGPIFKSVAAARLPLTAQRCGTD